MFPIKYSCRKNNKDFRTNQTPKYLVDPTKRIYIFIATNANLQIAIHVKKFSMPRELIQSLQEYEENCDWKGRQTRTEKLFRKHKIYLLFLIDDVRHLSSLSPSYTIKGVNPRNHKSACYFWGKHDTAFPSKPRQMLFKWIMNLLYFAEYWHLSGVCEEFLPEFLRNISPNDFRS